MQISLGWLMVSVCCMNLISKTKIVKLVWLSYGIHAMAVQVSPNSINRKYGELQQVVREFCAAYKI